MTKDPIKRLNTLIHGEEGALRFRELGEMADDSADEIERLRARVAELEKAARSVVFEPLAYGPTTTVRVDLLRALENLLPDQSGKGGSDA